MIIKKFLNEEHIQKEIEEIFWLTANTEERNPSIHNKYMGYYLENNKPIFYALDEDQKKVLGYILGDVTFDDSYTKLFPFYDKAMASLVNHPAHLHINCHPRSQGLGVGSKLLSHYEKFLKSQGVDGLHLVTASAAKNVKFYQKNLYLSLYETSLNGLDLIFLGKTLDA